MNKIALIIGINYTGTDIQLNGCINDANSLKKLLLEQYGYQDKNITMLTDDTAVKPTGHNIIKSMYDIAFRTKHEKIDSMFISYSGHGSYIYDQNGDEKDRNDEVIVPLDYKKGGMVTDDILNHILSYVHEDTKVVALFDACHSGTILDLQYRYISGDCNVKETDVNNVKADVILISGCRDNQTSADAYSLLKSGKYCGAMTASFLTTMKKFNFDIPCFKLLKHMRLYLEEKKFDQVPQLTCTFPITQTTAFSISNKHHRKPFFQT